jgi:hypothetical protein
MLYNLVESLSFVQNLAKRQPFGSTHLIWRGKVYYTQTEFRLHCSSRMWKRFVGITNWNWYYQSSFSSFEKASEQPFALIFRICNREAASSSETGLIILKSKCFVYFVISMFPMLKSFLRTKSYIRWIIVEFFIFVPCNTIQWNISCICDLE